jgi:fatty acid desaturase
MAPTYPPLAEVRDTLRVEWYRCPIEHAKLRELSKRSNLQGFLQAGGHLALFAATGYLVYHFWSQQQWLAFVVTLFAHGTVGSFLFGVAPHELGHGTVFRTKWLNKFFMYLFSLLSWWDPFDYASSHTYHHRYTQYVEGDRENVMPLVPSLAPFLLLQLLTINLSSPPGRNFGKGGFISTVFITVKSALGVVGATENPSREWIQALHDDQPAERDKSMWWSRLQLLFHGSVLAVAIITELWVLPLILTVFSSIGNWCVYAVGATQHCGLNDSTPDFRKCVRSIRINPIFSFLYWRMGWHTEHHMYAGVPCYNLRKLAREIADDMPEPRSLFTAWREMRETWHRQQAEPQYQFDTPLPANGQTSREDTPDELETSIGELAPEGLR